MKEFSYDRVPYHSYPFSQTHPEHLYTISKFFKSDPCKIEKAKILELGCASGGNIIPVAVNYPQSEIIGIDLSLKQVEEGQKSIAELNLKNIELKHLSISDIDKNFGMFDYIICHGVFSWVPEKIQNHIFRICRDNMNKNGVACISYNTLPGWNFVNSFRDMMIYHTKKIEDPETKAEQARSILNFILEGLDADNSPYAAFLKNEVELLSDKNNSYIIHEHLEEHNKAFYFHQFIEFAEKFNLKYLADTPVASMFHYNFPSEIANQLDEINDLIKLIQYMDFFRNQRFRTTLLCHSDCKINRKLTTNDVKDFCFTFNGETDETINQLELDEGEINFTNNGITMTVSNPISKLAIYCLIDNNKKPLSFNELVLKVKEKGNEKNLKIIETHILEELFLLRLILSGFILIHKTCGNYILEITEKPEASRLSRYQSGEKEIVTNQRHEILQLDTFERILIKLLDGTRSYNNIIDELIRFEKSDVFSIHDSKDSKITDSEKLKENIKNLYDAAMEKFIQNALIVG